MTLQQLKFNLTDNRVYKLIVSENFSEEWLKDKLAAESEFIIIEYNSLSEDKHEKPPFLNLLKKIVKELENNYTLPLGKKVLRNILFIVFLISFISGLAVSILGISELKLLQHVDKMIVYSTIGATILVCLIAFLVFEWPSKIEIINKHLGSRKDEKVDKLIQKGNHQINQYVKLIEPWFSKNKRYILLLYYINWEMDEEQSNLHVNKFISELLIRCDNVSLIYCIDKDDNSFSNADTLIKEIKAKEIRVEEIDALTEIYDELLNDLKNLIKSKQENIAAKKKKTNKSDEEIAELANLESINWTQFFEKFIRAIRPISSNEFELQIVRAYLDDIVNKCSESGEIELSQYINPADSSGEERKNFILKREKKSSRIVNRFFYEENCFGPSDKDLEYLFIALLYYQYFFGEPSNLKPLSQKLFEKMLAIHHNVHLILKMTDDDFLSYLLFDNREQEVSTYIKDHYLDNLFSKVYELKAVKFNNSTQKFSLNKEWWLINYIITNRDGLCDALDNKNYLNTSNLRQFDSYVKFFLFFSTYFDDYPEKQMEKLLGYIAPVERGAYQVFLSDKFSNTPFELENSIDKYIFSNRLAEDFWRFSSSISTNFNLNISLLSSFEIALKKLGVNPFKSLLMITNNALRKLNCIDMSFDDMIFISQNINNALLQEFPEENAVFESEFKKLQVRYNFYNAEYNYDDYDEYPEINLMKEIEESLVILLPEVDEKYAVQVPLIDTSAYLQIASNEPDFIFMQILVIVHNNYNYINNSFVKRKDANENELNSLLPKLVDFENVLTDLRKKELNYHDYCYLTLYDVKYYLVRNLFRKCQIEYEFKFYNTKEQYDSNKFNLVLERFKYIGDYFGIVDTLFWECWFETRLSIKNPDISESTSNVNDDIFVLDKSKVEKNIKSIIKYINDYVKYVHFDCGLVYMSLVSNTIIEPPKAYELIKKFISVKPTIPKFIKYQLIKLLQVICYNGSFKDKQLLQDESMQLLDQLFGEFTEYISPIERTHYLIMEIPIYIRNIKKNEEVLKEIFREVDDNLKSLNIFDRGLYYYNKIKYLYHNDNIEELLESNIINEAKRLLKNNKFYYLQFLRDYVSDYEVLVKSRRDEKYIERLNPLIQEHNELAKEYNEAKKASDNSSFLSEELITKKEKLNALSKEIEDINMQRSSLKSISSLKELVDELKEFEGEYELKNHFYGEDQPDKYVMATTALEIAHLFHDSSNIRSEDTIKYYEKALEYYYKLEEYIPFLEIALELKPLYASRHSLDKLSMIENKAKALLNEIFVKPGKMYQIQSDEPAQKRAERLANLIYDFFNTLFESTREDNSLYRGLNEKKEKITGYRKDNDTKGFRRLMLTYFTVLEEDNSLSKLINSFASAVEFARNNIDKISSDDIMTLENEFQRISKKIENEIDFQESKINIENDILLIRKAYNKKAFEFIETYANVNRLSA